MNGYQRIQAAFRGEASDTTPVMLHNFMMAAREAGVSMREYRSDPEAIARSFIHAVDKYAYDGIVVDIDTTTLAGAVGVPVDFPEHEPARCSGRSLASLEAVDDLGPADIARYRGVEVWLEATRLLVRHFSNEIFVRGNCDQAPFDLAALMLGIDDWMVALTDPSEHERAHHLLEYTTRVTNDFLSLMASTGAHMLSNGDSMASPDMVSPAIYRRFALPYERRVAARARELGLPYVLHICGKTDRILEEMASSGADGLELDYKTDVGLARAKFAGKTVFLGNIDPSGVLALGTPRLVAEKTRELLEVFRGEPRFVLNAGCAIPATTPEENLRAMIAAARDTGR
jgi:MtaA/CmuA family methyltransferase